MPKSSFHIILLIYGLPILSGCVSSKVHPQEGIGRPVTVLPSQPQLQGGSPDADRWEALKMNWRLQVFPECRNYMDEVQDAIFKKTSALDCVFTNLPIGTTFDVRIEIYQDGHIGGVAIYGCTNALVTVPYIKAIKDCTPFPKWPDKMRSVVGQAYWIMYINCGVPSPPPPG